MKEHKIILFLLFTALFHLKKFKIRWRKIITFVIFEILTVKLGLSEHSWYCWCSARVPPKLPLDHTDSCSGLKQVVNNSRLYQYFKWDHCLKEIICSEFLICSEFSTAPYHSRNPANYSFWSYSLKTLVHTVPVSCASSQPSALQGNTILSKCLRILQEVTVSYCRHFPSALLSVGSRGLQMCNRRKQIQWGERVQLEDSSNTTSW